MLDRTRAREHNLRLLDLYGPLLTEHQRHILHLAWEEDWSYSEVAEREGVSRTAIYDLVRRARTALQGYEGKLGLDRDRRNRARLAEAMRVRLSSLEREVSSLSRRLEHV
jgi:predicted DNA-binding protein YlxM (UPF0122 family)